MGGAGSGRVNEPRGRKPKAAVNVVGSGVPCPATELPADVQASFDRLAQLTSGTTFSQDSIAIELAARLMVRSSKLDDAITAKPDDAELHRLSLAIGRQLMALLGKFGLTPRDRQVLLVPRDDSPEMDDLERLMAERDGDQNRKGAGQ